MYFIGNFQHVTNQQSDEQDRRHGSFSLITQADTIDAALERFRERLVAFKATTSFFEGSCTIYIKQILEFDNFPAEEAVMVNFNSYAGDPIMPFISCVVPDEKQNSCSIHEWSKNRPSTEGKEDNIFIEFD